MENAVLIFINANTNNTIWLPEQVAIVIYCVLTIKYIWFIIIPFFIFSLQEYLRITQPAPLTCGLVLIAFVTLWKAKICQYAHKTVQVINMSFFVCTNSKIKSTFCFTQKVYKFDFHISCHWRGNCYWWSWTRLEERDPGRLRNLLLLLSEMFLWKGRYWG